MEENVNANVEETSAGNKKKGRGKKLVISIMLPALIAAVVIAVILTIISIAEINSTYLSLIEEELRAGAIQFESQVNSTYDGDWGIDEKNEVTKGDTEVHNEYEEFMDEMKAQTDMEYTLFMDKTRYITTVLDESTGQRMTGTDASDEVYQAVVKGGQNYLSEDIKIGGEDYIGFYTPLENPDGSIVGMVTTLREVSDMTNATTKITVMMILVALVCILIVIGIAIYLVISMTKVINGIVGNLVEIAHGNLLIDFDPKALARTDELGTIAQNTKYLDDKLIEVISTAKELAHNVSDAGDELSGSANQASEASNQVTEAVDEISKGAVGQAESVQNSANNTSEIGVDIEGITGSVNELTDGAKAMQQACVSSMDALNALLKQNESTIESMKVIDHQIKSTNDAVMNISEASNLITNISEQTNLLALNASIEAARAGDAGKGFAVVATEIGSLANQSQEATVKINQIVEELISESEKSVATVEELNKAFDEQNKQLDATKNDMNSMNEGVHNVTDSAHDINDRVNNLNNAKNNLISIIEDLSAISEENAASTEETNASMEELNATFEVISHSASELQELANKLSEDISYFKV